MKDINIFLIKASPTKDGVGRMILEQIREFLTDFPLGNDLTIYDQFLENDNPIYKQSSLRQFLISGDEDITPFENDITHSNGIIIICPVYLSQMPGVFKNTIDSFSYRAHEFPLIGKKVVIFTYCTSNGADDLAGYFRKIFSSMGAEVVSVQSYFISNSVLEGEMENLKTNISKMLERINHNQFRVTKGQEQLFQYYKNIVIEEQKEGFITNKHKRWNELLSYGSLVSYLEKKMIDS